MKDLFQAANDLQKFLQERDWRFCFIGGLAVVHWGEPRLTRDIDLTLLTGFGGEEKFVDELLAHFPARLPDARDFALENRTLLLSISEGFPVDIALGGLPFEEEATRRACDVECGPGIWLRLCSPEDLVVMKTFAGRPEDWRDIEGILVRQGSRLDVNYLLTQVKPLLAVREDEEAERRLRTLLSRMDPP